MLPHVDSTDDDGDAVGGDSGALLCAKQVGMKDAGTTAEVDPFPLFHAYARIARRAGVRLGRVEPSPPVLLHAESGRVVRGSVAAVGSGGAPVHARERVFAGKRDAFVAALRAGQEGQDSDRC